MKIELQKIKIRDITKNYKNNEEEWVIWFDWKLNIRPKYQREFVYKEAQRNAVIETIKKNFPLNIMYWAKNEDGTFEVLDWQQRTISICEYVIWNFTLNNLAFHNLTEDKKNEILDYELTIYICEWVESEKLEWFQTINIAWEKLTEQELRNAVYTWTWLNDAKKYFSKTNCPAYQIGKNYLKWSPIRQEYLETVLKWISNGEIEKYMSENQQNENASELWQYFQSIIHWINIIFPNYRKEMKGLDWWFLYNNFWKNFYNAVELEEKIKKLMMDDEVTKKSGIYLYLLDWKEKHLSIRIFTENQKRETYEKQNWFCANKKDCINLWKKLDINEMEADHITPWSKWWKTNIENCQMLCLDCNRKKSWK